MKCVVEEEEEEVEKEWGDEEGKKMCEGGEVALKPEKRD